MASLLHSAGGFELGSVILDCGGVLEHLWAFDILGFLSEMLVWVACVLRCISFSVVYGLFG